MIVLSVWVVVSLILFASLLWGASYLRAYLLTKYHINNDFLKMVHQFLGLIYGLVLAFVLIFSWQNYNHVNKNIDVEAIALTDIWNDSAAFPKNSREPFQKAVADYVKSIQAEEWPLMTQGISPPTSSSYVHIWETANRLQVKTKNQKYFFANLVDELNRLNESRMQRIFATKSSISGILWLGLIIGAACMILLTELYNTNRKLRRALSSIEALFLAFALYLIFHFNHPFQGPSGLENDSYQYVEKNFLHLGCVDIQFSNKEKQERI